MMAADPPLGSLLQRFRLDAAFSQEALAERAGLSVRAVSDLERGLRQAPRLETIRLLADALRLGESDRAALISAARPTRTGPPVESARTALPGFAGPLPLTRLIGRDDELTKLSALLSQGEHRLVTLTGPGGVGKTRLALAIGSALRSHFRDGLWFVDLSTLTDAALVVPAIAMVLGVPESVEESLVSLLGRRLRDRRLLLILDNCEQVLAAAPDLGALLASTAEVVILATSREPLRLQGEREYHLAPLPLPAAGDLREHEAFAKVPSAALFVERATARSPEFILTADNVAAVAAICHRLDGLPLAIELAAARVNVLPPETLLKRLEQRLPLLTGGSRDLPIRQRTMRDAIAWSYDLLAASEQILFRRLAVFAGGFTLASAEAMSEPQGDAAALDGIAALIDHSLLRQITASNGEPRYLMLETVREFGLERLAAENEEDEARACHARYFLHVSDDLSHVMYSILGSWTLMKRMAVELDNVRLAVAWFAQHREFDTLLRMASVLWGVWYARGLFREGRTVVEGALAQSSPQASAARVQALDGAGSLAVFHGEYARAAPFFAEERLLAEELGDHRHCWMALGNAGLLASRQGMYTRAETFFREAFGLLPDHTDRDLRGWSHLWLGDMALVQGHIDQASDHYREALTLFHVLQAEMGEGIWDWGLAEVQTCLGHVHSSIGDLVQAATHYAEGLSRAHDLEVEVLAVGALLGLAGVVAASGDVAGGARLFGAAEGIAESVGAPVFPRDMPARDRSRAALIARLDAQHLDAELAHGRTWTFDLTIAEAMRLSSATQTALARPASASWGGGRPGPCRLGH